MDFFALSLLEGTSSITTPITQGNAVIALLFGLIANKEKNCFPPGNWRNNGANCNSAACTGFVKKKIKADSLLESRSFP